MSQHDDQLPMHQMLEHAREALALIRGLTRDDLHANRLLQLGLVKLIEIVGEAARRVSPETQARYTQIPWRKAITTRDRLTHGYDVIDYDVVWDTIADDFPALVTALERALSGAAG